MIEAYLDSWEGFRFYCEGKAKNRCFIPSAGWTKLKRYHLEQYLQNNDNPYFFLLTVKWKRDNLFREHGMAHYYQVYSRKAKPERDPQVFGIIDFPSWRK